jgi:hypothetical protein
LHALLQLNVRFGVSAALLLRAHCLSPKRQSQKQQTMPGSETTAGATADNLQNAMGGLQREALVMRVYDRDAHAARHALRPLRLLFAA